MSDLEGKTWKTCPTPVGSKPPCVCGKPIHARGMCANCYNKWLKANNPEFKKRQLEGWKARYQADEEFRDRVKGHAKAADKRTTTQQKRAKRLKSWYGIPEGAESGLLLRQNGLCEICLQPPKPGRILVADHCHETGEFRGLICKRCNTGLAFFRDSSTVFDRAAKYLRAAQGEQPMYIDPVFHACGRRVGH